ncbi:PBP1A family penicillin-binding protein [Desulfuromonas sp. CSMB_57]|uniref:penicillin-binding protein 1A n=1 Tax=Desulfuromonas sp. CSMB_57 TaxID=2807629 RepID=UPI001CD612E5|nr:PBP1A family penicillin-binding protein [Desulfuromonas sp. CSMB_57]
MNSKQIIPIILWSLAGLLVTGCALLLAGYLWVAASLPKVDTLADYHPPIVTQVFADDGTVLAEFAQERRILVPVNSMPELLLQSFVAAEDANFYRHPGIDLLSILRAAMKNILAGGIRQGGSTITQQVAKSLLLTPERKFSRKFKEAILAWRIEKKLAKEDILYLYLNQIYLGHGAYGVQAAAENYFGKNVNQLTLAECAMLGGLPQAPSRYSPYRNYPAAKERQRYVLARMVKEGFITEEMAAAADRETIKIQPRPARQVAGSDYFTEQVRRYIEERYGAQALTYGGLKVYTTMNVEMQQAAQEAVQSNLRRHDRRWGFRGPLRTLSAGEQNIFVARQEATIEQPPAPGSLIEGVLTGQEQNRLLVRVGRFTGSIPLSSRDWLGQLTVVPRGQPAQTQRGRGRLQMPVGSVLLLRVSKVEGQHLVLALEQVPEAQAALVALDPNNGQVKAMVGGYDFRHSQFNRAIQARRLPGSAFKPLIYAAALDKGYTPATIVMDTPVSFPGGGREWSPKNYDGTFRGPLTVRQALTHSNNVVTVKMLQDIGVRYAIGYARKLGIQSPLNNDLTLALGSSAVSPLELATAYCAFANGGVRVNPVYVTKVVDRTGRVLESIDPADFPGGPGRDQQWIRLSPERVISPETAFLITNLMESVVQEGTGQIAKSLARPVAAKTGTTNDLKDAWFVGFTPQLVALSWVGYDQERSLGYGETGARAAAPAWLDFMQRAVRHMAPQSFHIPDSIEFRPIDRASGLLAPEDRADVTIEAFAPGTAPTRFADQVEQPRSMDFYQLDLEEEN